MFKLIAPLSVIIALRFFGLFVVLPVISVYAWNLEGSTPQLVGFVIGGYAITQMVFQVPFGVLSDKIGRKYAIVIGLVIFIIGSIISAMSSDIYGLLLGRFLQGAGAIGAVATAMISDLVREEQRPKAMAMMGGTIALSFALAMVIGPTLGASAGINSLFYLTAILAAISIYVLLAKVPNPPKITHTYHDANKYEFLKNGKLIIMNITNFLQKGLMTFAFLIIPIVLTQTYGWEYADLWKIYIPAMVAGIISMGPAAIFAEKKGKFKEVLIVGIVFFALAYYIIGGSSDEFYFAVGVVVFFMGFNMHEPIMQSLATKYAKVHQKGAILGVFNSFGYFGTFMGGVFGGMIYSPENIPMIANVIIIVSICWIVLITMLPNPLKTKNTYIDLKDTDLSKHNSLDDESGVEEWYINDTEQIIIIKYSDELTNEEKIKSIIK